MLVSQKKFSAKLYLLTHTCNYATFLRDNYHTRLILSEIKRRRTCITACFTQKIETAICGARSVESVVRRRSSSIQLHNYHVWSGLRGRVKECTRDLLLETRFVDDYGKTKP